MLEWNGWGGYIIVSVLVIIPFWKIFRKAGFNPLLSILLVVPLVNLGILYYIAFTPWRK